MRASAFLYTNNQLLITKRFRAVTQPLWNDGVIRPQGYPLPAPPQPHSVVPSPTLLTPIQSSPPPPLAHPHSGVPSPTPSPPPFRRPPTPSGGPRPTMPSPAQGCAHACPPAAMQSATSIPYLSVRFINRPTALMKSTGEETAAVKSAREKTATI